jgi:hypothetical protein
MEEIFNFIENIYCEPMKIKGKVTFQNLGVGFWGIIDDEGQKWRPLKMPRKLQKEGLEVEIEAEESANQMSVFMWGKAIEIKSHKTL